MYHLCTTAAFQTIYQKRKILDIQSNIEDFSFVVYSLKSGGGTQVVHK